MPKQHAGTSVARVIVAITILRHPADGAVDPQSGTVVNELMNLETNSGDPLKFSGV